MKLCKSGKYNNYGSIPRNEYIAANKKNNIDSIVSFEQDAQADDTMSVKSKPHVKYPPISGWKRAGKANGWRAELASRQDKSVEARRYYNYVVGENSTPLNKIKSLNDQKKDTKDGAIKMFYFITEEMNLIFIYKADTLRETLANMQAARSYIDDIDILAILDSATDKLYNITDTVFSVIFFDQNLDESMMF